jgi:hypothetical protein
LGFDADGFLHAGAASGGIWTWQPDGRGALSETGSDTAITALAFGPTGQLVVSDGRAVLDEFVLLEAGAYSGALAADGRIAIGCDDHAVLLWPDAGGAPRQLGRHHGRVTAAAFAPDGRLATGSVDGVVRLWDPDGQPLYSRADAAGTVTALGFGADGRLVVTCGGFLRIWPSGTDGAELTRLARRFPLPPLTTQQRQAAQLPLEPTLGR